MSDKIKLKSKGKKEQVIYSVQPEYIPKWWFYLQIPFLILALIFLLPFWFIAPFDDLLSFRIPLPLEIRLYNPIQTVIGVISAIIFQVTYKKSLKAYKPAEKRIFFTNTRIVEVTKNKKIYMEEDLNRRNVKEYHFELVNRSSHTMGHPLLIILISWFIYFMVYSSPIGELGLFILTSFPRDQALYGFLVVGIVVLIFLGLTYGTGPKLVHSPISERSLSMDFSSFGTKRYYKYNVLFEANRYDINYGAFLTSGEKIRDVQIANLTGIISSFSPSTKADYRKGQGAHMRNISYQDVGLSHGATIFEGSGLNKLLWGRLIYKHFQYALFMLCSLIATFIFLEGLYLYHFITSGKNIWTLQLTLYLIIMIIGIMYIVHYTIKIVKRLLNEVDEPTDDPIGDKARKKHKKWVTYITLTGVVAVEVTLKQYEIIGFNETIDWIFAAVIAIAFTAFARFIWGIVHGYLALHTIVDIGKRGSIFHSDKEKISEPYTFTSFLEKSMEYKYVYQCFSNKYIPSTEYEAEGNHYKPLGKLFQLVLFNIWLALIFIIHIIPLLVNMNLLKIEFFPLYFAIFSIIGVAELILIVKHIMMFKVIDKYQIKFCQQNLDTIKILPSYRTYDLLCRRPSHFLDVANCVQNNIKGVLMNENKYNKTELKQVSASPSGADASTYAQITNEFQHNQKLRKESIRYSLKKQLAPLDMTKTHSLARQKTRKFS
jgi:hypothetical protein